MYDEKLCHFPMVLWSHILECMRKRLNWWSSYSTEKTRPPIYANGPATKSASKKEYAMITLLRLRRSGRKVAQKLFCTGWACTRSISKLESLIWIRTRGLWIRRTIPGFVKTTQLSYSNQIRSQLLCYLYKIVSTIFVPYLVICIPITYS